MEKQTKIPAFTYDISTWFMEHRDAEKLQFIVAAIPLDVAVLLCGLLHNPPENNKYAAIIPATVRRYSVCGCRPFVLLSHMQALNNASETPMPELLLHNRHLQLMPTDLSLHLAA